MRYRRSDDINGKIFPNLVLTNRYYLEENITHEGGIFLKAKSPFFGY